MKPYWRYLKKCIIIETVGSVFIKRRIAYFLLFSPAHNNAGFLEAYIITSIKTCG